MKIFLCILFSAKTLLCAAQVKIDITKEDVSPLSHNILSTVGGEPVLTAKFAKVVEGSAYFSEEWIKGIVVVNGTSYPGVWLKLDLLDNEVHYRNTSGGEMIATKQIEKIILADTAAGKVFTFIHSSFIPNNSGLKKGWYQVLATGEISVLKQTVKRVKENTPYGSATIEQTITSTSHYFLLNKGGFVEVKKIKNIPDILTDKKIQLLQYIADNKLTGKTDKDYQNLVEYYNSLKLQRSS